jgi:anti-sigma factor RsiW
VECDVVIAYVAGELDPLASLAVEAHLVTCDNRKAQTECGARGREAVMHTREAAPES